MHRLGGTLGPGELAYLPVGGEIAVPDRAEPLQEVTVASLRGWLESLSTEDVEESSVAAMDRVVVLRRREQPIGAAGHLDWPAGVGHIGVLVAPGARGTGVGTCLGAAETAEPTTRPGAGTGALAAACAEARRPSGLG